MQINNIDILAIMSEKIRPQQLNRTLAFVRKEREKTKVYEKKTFLYEVESSGEKNLCTTF